jgi:hypothetical protein
MRIIPISQDNFSFLYLVLWIYGLRGPKWQCRWCCVLIYSLTHVSCHLSCNSPLAPLPWHCRWWPLGINLFWLQPCLANDEHRAHDRPLRRQPIAITCALSWGAGVQFCLPPWGVLVTWTHGHLDCSLQMNTLMGLVSFLLFSVAIRCPLHRCFPICSSSFRVSCLCRWFWWVECFLSSFPSWMTLDWELLGTLYSWSKIGRLVNVSTLICKYNLCPCC